MCLNSRQHIFFGREKFRHFFYLQKFKVQSYVGTQAFLPYLFYQTYPAKFFSELRNKTSFKGTVPRDFLLQLLHKTAWHRPLIGMMPYFALCNVFAVL
jgi:hypothetical protein